MHVPSSTTAVRHAAGLTVAAVVVSLAPVGAAYGASRIGPVQDLTVGITKPSQYRVDADWANLAGATRYQVTLTDQAGTVLERQSVTDSDWTVSRALQVGTQVTVKVVPYGSTKRPGRPASQRVAVPDRTAPTGTFVVAVPTDSRTVTVTQTALQDDLSAAADVTREISWDDGSAVEPFPTGTVATHDYPAGKHVYYPSVRLTDQAGNTVDVALDPVAIDDTDAPQGAGAFTVSVPTTTWARVSWVTLAQTGALSDDVSAPENIARTVDWGDGTQQQWTGTDPLRHVYATAATYTPTVTLTDEALRSSVVETAAVVVTADTSGPRASLTKPSRRLSVRAWRTLRGKATDAQTGVHRVKVRVVERRRGTWFAYQAPARTWVKAASRQGALRKSRVASVRTVDGAWRARVTGLRKGVLVVKVQAMDKVGNRSRLRTYQQELTRR